MMNKDKILKKWTPVLENIGIVNSKLRDILCLFSEDYCIRNPNKNDLQYVIEDILKTLDKTKKIEVVKTVYNPIMGRIEYHLENGLRVDENNRFNKDELSTKDIVSLFGIDFAREIDKQGFREERINEILNG